MARLPRVLHATGCVPLHAGESLSLNAAIGAIEEALLARGAKVTAQAEGTIEFRVPFLPYPWPTAGSTIGHFAGGTITVGTDSAGVAIEGQFSVRFDWIGVIGAVLLLGGFWAQVSSAAFRLVVAAVIWLLFAGLTVFFARLEADKAIDGLEQQVREAVSGGPPNHGL